MSETTQDILVHTEAGVCTITFNRADKKNSITEAMYASMADALAQAGEDAAVRCVVFQGDMAIFSAGNDIADFLKQSAGGAAGCASALMRWLRSGGSPHPARRAGGLPGCHRCARLRRARAGRHG